MPDAGLEEEEACKKQALRLLAFRDRSEMELREALQKRGYCDSGIDAVVDFLKVKKYIDDVRYSKNWAEYRMESAPVGPFRLAAQLRGKGFCDSLVRDISDSVWSRYDEFEVAFKLVKKRYAKAGTTLSGSDLRRAYSFLQRKGFSGDIAERVLSELGK